MVEFAYFLEDEEKKEKGLSPYKNGQIRPSQRPTTAEGVDFSVRPPRKIIVVKTIVKDPQSSQDPHQ